MVQIQSKLIMKIKNVLLLLTLSIMKMQEMHVMLKQVLFGKILKLFLNRKFLNFHQNLLFNHVILEFTIVEQLHQNNHSVSKVHMTVAHVLHHQFHHQLVLEVDLLSHLNIIHPVLHYQLT